MSELKPCRCEDEGDVLRVSKDATYCWGCDTLGFDGRLWIPAGEVAALQSRIEELEANISTLAVAIGVEGAGSELTVEHAIARIGRLQSSNAELLAWVQTAYELLRGDNITFNFSNGVEAQGVDQGDVMGNRFIVELLAEAQRLIKEQK